MHRIQTTPWFKLHPSHSWSSFLEWNVYRKYLFAVMMILKHYKTGSGGNLSKIFWCSIFTVRFRFTVCLWTSQILDVLAILLMLTCVAEPVLFDMHVVSDTSQLKWHTSKWGSHFWKYIALESSIVGLEIYWYFTCNVLNISQRLWKISFHALLYKLVFSPKTCNVA